MADENTSTEGQDEQENTTYTQTQIDAAVAEAKKGQDRFVASIQEGKEVPKWVKDAGFDSAEAALAAMQRQGDTPEATDTVPEFDESQYLDDDGRLTAEGRREERVYMAAVARREAQEVFRAENEAALTAAEQQYIQAAAQNAPELLLPNGDDDKEFVASLVDGLVARTVKDGVASSQQVAAESARAADYLTRAVDAEIARRAEKAKVEADVEAPAGGPGAGDGQPKKTVGDEAPPNETPQARMERLRNMSRAKFAQRHAG